MVKIRLRRVGAKNQPSYRIVVTDSRSPRDGRFIEKIGFYNPRTEPATVELDEERALYWLSVGAQPSDAVRRLLEKQGTMKRLERLNAGETLEKLAAEAQKEKEARPPVDPRTRRDDLLEAKANTKKKSKAEAPAAVAEAAPDEAASEAAEAVAEAEPEATAEEATETEAE